MIAAIQFSGFLLNDELYPTDLPGGEANLDAA